MGVIQAQGSDFLSTGVCSQDHAANLWGNFHADLRILGTDCAASDCMLAASAGELIWDKGITNKSLPPPVLSPALTLNRGNLFLANRDPPLWTQATGPKHENRTNQN